MKSYEEITKNLLERRDRYFADKKIKNKKIVAIVAPICCVAIVSLLVIGVWKGDNFNNSLKIDNDDQTQGQLVDNETEKETDALDKVVSTNENTNTGEKTTDKHNNTNKKPDNETEEATDSDDTSEGIINSYPDKHHSHNNNKDNNIVINQNQDTTKEPKYIERIEVTQKPIKSVYYVGDKFDFTGLEVTGYFTNGDVEDVTAGCNFYTTGYAPLPYKKYRITVEYYDNTDLINGAWTELVVTIIEPDIDISKKSITLDVGESTQNTVITEATGCNISWYSTDTSVVTVDDSGNVTAVGSGNASVYAVISFNSFKKESPYCTVTVNESDNQMVTE